jgi:hypothetical protein
MLFDGSVDFAREIEKRTRGKNPSYLDAVLDVCDTFGVEPQSIAKHLSKPVIEKIRMEASGKHLLRGKEKYKGTRLPL